MAYEIVHHVFFMKRARERYVTQSLDYLGLRIQIPKIDCMQRKRSQVKRALAKLKDIVRRLADKEPALNTSLSIGYPFEEIVKFSAQKDVDLIVMSTHGRTGLRHILLGGTTERVMSHAACPVLVLKKTGEAK
jgi:nucleotide-binding universal stress UspA family protein